MTDERAQEGEKERMDKIESICIKEARKLPPGTSDTDRLNKFTTCVIESLEEAQGKEAAATRLDRIAETVPADGTPPVKPAAPPVSPIAAQIDYCQKEAAKATNPHLQAGFLAWCLADIPPQARPTYALATPEAPALAAPAPVSSLASSEPDSELRFEVSARAKKGIPGGTTRTYSTALAIPENVLADIRQFVITQLVPDSAFIAGWKTQLEREFQEEAARKQNPRKNRRKYIQQWLDLFAKGDADHIQTVLRKRNAEWVLQVPGDAWTKLIAWRVAQRLAVIYERVFALGVQHYCWDMRQDLSCEDFTKEIFFRHYVPDTAELGKPTKYSVAKVREIAKQYGRGSTNPENIVYGGLHASSVAMQDTVAKLRSFQAFLTEQAHVSALMSYLMTGYLPTPIRYGIAAKWMGERKAKWKSEREAAEKRGEAAPTVKEEPISPSWVRDITFGWRRRLDQVLTKQFPEFEMNRVSDATAQLRHMLTQAIRALFYKTPSDRLTFQDRYILKILGKKHLLHLLIHPTRELPAGALVNRRSGFAAASEDQVEHAARANTLRAQLAQQFAFSATVQKVYPAHMALTAPEFLQAAADILAEARAALTELQNTYAHETLPSKQRYYKHQVEEKEVFVKTCELMQNPIVVDQIMKIGLFEVILPAAKQFHAFASIIGAMRVDLGPRPEGKPQLVSFNTHLRERCGPNRLRGVLGAILARACFAKYLQKGKPVMDVAQTIVSWMTPEALLTAPFCAVSPTDHVTRRRGRKGPKQVYPLDLSGISFSYPPIFRQESFEELTVYLREQVVAKRGVPRFLCVLPATLHLLHRASGIRESKKVSVGDLLTAVLKAKAQDASWGKNPLTLQEQTYLEDLFSKGRLDALVNPYRLPHKPPPEGTKGVLQEMGVGVPMEARLSKRMRTLFAHPHTQLRSCRLLPPAFGSGKVVVNCVLEASKAAFAFAPAFVKAVPRAKGQQQDPPETPLSTDAAYKVVPRKILGIDFNRLSPFIMEMATPDHILDIKADLQEVFKIAQKLRWVDYCGSAHTPGLFQTLLQSAEVCQALDTHQDLLQALAAEVQQASVSETRDFLVQWRRQTLLDQVTRVLATMVSDDTQPDRQVLAKKAQRIFWQHWRLFQRGVYVEIAAVQRALAVCQNDLEAKTSNWKRVLHHLTHLPPKHYPKWDLATVRAYLGQRVRRLEKELTLLHQRKARLKAQLDREVSLAGARILIREGAAAVAAENLELTTRDKPKKLAKYITDMPKQAEIVAQMAQWASYTHTAVQGHPVKVKSYFVDPRGTSRTHANCGGALQTVQGQADVQICAKCGATVPRHGNSAQLIARRGQEEIEQS